VQLNWKLNFPPLPNSLEVVVGVAGIVTGENADGSELDDSTVDRARLGEYQLHRF